jgi:phosphatidylserine decarboxylase
MKTYSRPDPPSQFAFPIARPGYPVIFAAAFVTAVLALLELTVPTLVALLGTLFAAYFFRDPDRMIPNEDRCVVSPADGKILKAQTVADSPYYDGPSVLISIFMSVFNVHVNRVPFEGQIDRIEYVPGKFIAANLDKSSSDNERNALFLKTADGHKMTVVQIAGLIARRIICNVNPGDTVQRGQRFGMICFGSRLDVYLPPEAEPQVSVGQTVSAGSSLLARLKP